MLKKIGRVDYQIEMPHRRKKNQIFHINLLKKWEPPAMSFMTTDVEENEEFPDWKERSSSVLSPSAFGSQLMRSQKKELSTLLKEFGLVRLK